MDKRKYFLQILLVLTVNFSIILVGYMMVSAYKEVNNIVPFFNIYDNPANSDVAGVYNRAEDKFIIYKRDMKNNDKKYEMLPIE